MPPPLPHGLSFTFATHLLKKRKERGRELFWGWGSRTERQISGTELEIGALRMLLHLPVSPVSSV